MTIELRPLSVAVFSALASDDTDDAEQLLGLPIPTEFAEAVEIWRYMLDLMVANPDNADWAMQAVIDDGVIVGNAGFKGIPNDGVVELGYRIVESRRRQGLAGAAVELLLGQARAHPKVASVIARISPNNNASIGVVTKAGFSQCEDHQHPRWGRQLQFRHDLAGPGD